MTRSSSLINLLERLTKCRETFYLLDDQFILTRVQPDGSDAYGKGMGKGVKFPCPLWASHSP